MFCTVSVLTAFWLEVRHLERAEMELSDGLLLQVNNGEQGGNRWKHSNEDSVRALKYLCFVKYLLIYQDLSQQTRESKICTYQCVYVVCIL